MTLGLTCCRLSAFCLGRGCAPTSAARVVILKMQLGLWQVPLCLQALAATLLQLCCHMLSRALQLACKGCSSRPLRGCKGCPKWPCQVCCQARSLQLQGQMAGLSWPFRGCLQRPFKGYPKPPLRRHPKCPLKGCHKQRFQGCPPSALAASAAT